MSGRYNYFEPAGSNRFSCSRPSYGTSSDSGYDTGPGTGESSVDGSLGAPSTRHDMSWLHGGGGHFTRTPAERHNSEAPRLQLTRRRVPRVETALPSIDESCSSAQPRHEYGSYATSPAMTRNWSSATLESSWTKLQSSQASLLHTESESSRASSRTGRSDTASHRSDEPLAIRAVKTLALVTKAPARPIAGLGTQWTARALATLSVATTVSPAMTPTTGLASAALVAATRATVLTWTKLTAGLSAKTTTMTTSTESSVVSTL
ncbi:hypothetical protein BJ546DRAFT_164095 [Cryomyces antarcticus]|uniref:Uncharacterized protein n=1 Tax=Cryomyces antarcticus TaxID=329879 RepID=A0ABR0M0H9_9PEZI|nr:hypothetical protein LTR39_000077 [Cryomyces antarcticus]KAK5020695.1 hypothetical protein LTR60_000294 [Cryomyces antarcticus]KAK5257593.1 hypothetical protein LTR16_000167 [Cryomyces antarcticus]